MLIACFASQCRGQSDLIKCEMALQRCDLEDYKVFEGRSTRCMVETPPVAHFRGRCTTLLLLE